MTTYAMSKKFVHVLLDKNVPDDASGLWVDPMAITSVEIVPTTEFTGVEPTGWYVRGMCPGQVFVIPKDSHDPNAVFDSAGAALDFAQKWLRVQCGSGTQIGL